MHFDWDISNINHIALHAVTPEEAEQVIENDPCDVGVVFRNGEPRTLHLVKPTQGEFYLSSSPSAMGCIASSQRVQLTGKNAGSTPIKGNDK